LCRSFGLLTRSSQLEPMAAANDSDAKSSDFSLNITADHKDDSKNVLGLGRQKLKIKFIQEKHRRQITFSKRKAGLLKKAYELSTLTGTQALLLVVSETGSVYSFATSKLQPFVALPESLSLIQQCLKSGTESADSR